MRNKKLIILFSVLLALTLLVVFNSVLFSVQHVNAYCANVEKSEQAANVLKNHGIRRGSSIFFVNKKKVTDAVERNVPDVRVLNIEKKFPNRVYINYVEVKPYVKVASGGKTYLCDNGMRITAVDPVTEPKTISLKVSGTLPEFEVSDTLSFTAPSGLSAADVVSEIFSGLEQLGYYDTVIDIFEEIDLTGNFIVLRTRLGMVWEIISADGLAEKMRFALSVYNKLLQDGQSKGTLIVTGPKKASFRAGDGTVQPV